MRLIYKHVLISKLTLAVIGFFWLPAQAHLMEAQQGTLNIIDDRAFMVLSLPISAFEDIDDNEQKLKNDALYEKSSNTFKK